MATLIAFSKWLETTNVSWAVRGGMPWIWPACETLHFFGLCLLVGVIGVMDLRLMGRLKGIPIGPLERLVPWAVAGFVINVITGLLFYVGAPGQYYGNSMFWAKMAFIALAGINVLVFNLSGISRVVDMLGPEADTPRSAKLIGATSLFLWAGVIFFGRMLPFIGGAF
jgi:hypothetical protein